MVVRFGENVVPVLTTFPPEAASYQVNVPVQPPADKLTTPGPHRAAPVVVGAAGDAFTVTVRVQKLVPPPEPVMSSLKVNDPAAPAFTQTVAALVAPQNVAPEVLSVKDQL